MTRQYDQNPPNGEQGQPDWHRPASQHGYPPSSAWGTPMDPQRRSPSSPSQDRDSHPGEAAPRPSYPPRQQVPYRHQYHVPPPPPPPPERHSRRGGPSFVSVTLVSITAVVLLFFVAVCGLAAAYVAIAADLPSPETLRSQAATFVSTRIYDRNGHLLPGRIRRPLSCLLRIRVPIL